jgi:hypothetical protein
MKITIDDAQFRKQLAQEIRKLRCTAVPDYLEGTRFLTKELRRTYHNARRRAIRDWLRQLRKLDAI